MPSPSVRTRPRPRHALDLAVRLRTLRRERGLTMIQVSRDASLSKSALSQIESGRSDPSLQTLRRLAVALQVPLARFFETAETPGHHVVRADQRKLFSISRNRLRYELLTADVRNKRVEFLRVEFRPDGGAVPELYAHDGEEYGFVVSGEVEVCLDRDRHRLRRGDSIFFPGRIPHSVRSSGRRRAVMIWAISPPRY